MPLSTRERAHNFYMRRKLNGLCTRCGKPLDRDGQYCKSCCENIRIEARENRIFRAGLNLCTQCGKYAVPEGEKMCPECRAKNNNRRKMKSEKSKENFRIQQKRLYDQRSKDGICVRCGKREASPGKSRCGICLQKDAQMHRDLRARNGDDLRRQWMEQGLCYHCGGEIEDKSMKSCDACRKKCAPKHQSCAGKNKAWIDDNKLIFKRY